MPLSLDLLRDKLKDWKGCALAAHANRVLGEGNPYAEVVFIGEAPGAKEDELGRPFVGPAGKFLDELLASIGLKREDVYITNVVNTVHRIIAIRNQRKSSHASRGLNWNSR